MSVPARINLVFNWEDRKYRVLDVDIENNVAWCIDIVNPRAMPEPLPNSAVVERPVIVESSAMPFDMPKRHRTFMEKAWKCLKQLLDKNTDGQLFHPASRKKALERAPSYGCAESTMYNYLRRYWQRGQTPSALAPDFSNCGAPVPGGGKDENANITSKRGRSTEEGIKPYQLTKEDLVHMQDVVESVLHKDRRLKVADAYTVLISRHFVVTDGQGAQRVRPVGERPSMRQFRYFYKSHYNLETRLRAKYGDKHVDLNLRAVLGVTGKEAPFAGHSYEIDATVLPATAVAAHDRVFVVGKPVLYLIYDRHSKPIVGYYLGLENSSWMAAMMAIYCVAESKEALCARYGVPYDPADWPADGVLPAEFITDKGSEWTGKMSDDFVGRTGCTLKTLPATRADWKPTVENGHRLVQDFLRTVEPSFDPDSNSMSRQKMHYGKNACCTLAELNTFVLTYIIDYNKRVMRNHRETLDQVTSDFVASPINLWNYSVAHDVGITAPYTEEEVRFQLLPRDRATVTKIGIVFKGIVYVSPDKDVADAFVRARNQALRVEVSYDPRYVDRIYVHGLRKGGPVLASLSERNVDLAGMSFAEALKIEKARRDKSRLAEPDQLQGRVVRLEAVKPIVEKALKETKLVTKGKARKVRRDDIVEDREAERTVERKARNLVPAAKAAKPHALESTNAAELQMTGTLPPVRSPLQEAARIATAAPTHPVKKNHFLARVAANVAARQQAK